MFYDNNHNISSLNAELHSEVGKKLKKSRELLKLTINIVAKATGISFPTIKRIEEAEGNPLFEKIAILIHFYGFRFDEFFDFDSSFPSERTLKNRMRRFHEKYKSDSYEIIFNKPRLIDLIEKGLINDIIEDWTTSQMVFNYCIENFGHDYSNAPNTLDLAVKKGFLIRHPTATPKQYKRK